MSLNVFQVFILSKTCISCDGTSATSSVHNDLELQAVIMVGYPENDVSI